MTKGRLEAFSDGVIAIIITIMVLELKVPHGADWEALRPVLPRALTYVLSFLFVGIYWNNHHHMLHAADHVNGKILWANLHLLFWMSLIPFTTGWMGESHVAPVPTAVYGGVLLLAGIGYYVLERTIIATHGPHSRLAVAVGGNDRKGLLSTILYAAAVALAFVHAWVAVAIYLLVALMWLIPDPRIERKLHAG
jgi:uncharacterized membrane protein